LTILMMSSIKLTNLRPLKNVQFCQRSQCRSGEIGRRRGLKILRGQLRLGSIPSSGTTIKSRALQELKTVEPFFVFEIIFFPVATFKNKEKLPHLPMILRGKFNRTDNLIFTASRLGLQNIDIRCDRCINSYHSLTELLLAIRCDE
jgi:hypothetical protein